MKAVLFHQHGGREVLQYTDFPTPEPRPGEMLVKLQAAALNRLDIWVRRGWPGIKLQYPHIPGADGAGVVAALGEGVTDLAVGDAVVLDGNIGDGTCDACLAGMDNQCRHWNLLGETLRGTYAEYIAVPARYALKMPPGFDPHAAAAAALVYMTAWHSLISRGQLKAGESVLVVGASGGVNTAYIQIAKWAKASLYVVGSNEKKLELAKSLGADFLIDRSKEENWSKTVFELTDKRGVDIVADNVGTTYLQSMRSLRKGGRILTVGSSAASKFEFDNRYMFAKHLTLIGSTMAPLGEFKTVMDLVFKGELKPVMDKTFPLAEARAAQERLESGEQMGKITLAIV